MGRASLAVALLVATFALGACTAPPFVCSSDSQCTSGGQAGTCEATGFCSFPDDGCETGRRYGEYAGDDLGGECVASAVAGDDAGTDGDGGNGNGRSCALAVTAGALSDHACALLEDGTGACWGQNASGQLGGGQLGGTLSLPTKVQKVDALAQLAVGGAHTCALTQAGKVWCWGADDRGQLGDEDSSNAAKSEPTQIKKLNDVVELAAGGSHVCARKSGGSVWCWGGNADGQLGVAAGSDKKSPVEVPGLTGAVELAAGSVLSCARKSDGTVACWGLNDEGELGAGDMAVHTGPAQVAGLTNAVSLAVGDDHACAARADGTVVCWGDGEFGQLGNGAVADKGSFVLVDGLTDVVAVAAGDEHSCARLSSGGVRCWGRNTEGELGAGTVTNLESRPVAVAGLTDAASVSVGAHHVCVRRQSGALACWGRNAEGQLGDGSAEARLSPTTVALSCP